MWILYTSWKSTKLKRTLIVHEVKFSGHQKAMYQQPALPTQHCKKNMQ